MADFPLLAIDFREGGNAGAFLLSGWSTPETHGTWTMGRESRIVFPPHEAALARALRIVAAPCVPESNTPPAQRLEVVVNGHPALSIATGTPIDVACEIPPGAAVAGLDIVFLHPDAVQPRMVSASSDDRWLAFLFQRVELVTGAEPDTAAPAEPEAAEPPPGPDAMTLAIDFTNAGNSADFATSGLSKPEQFGTWSLGAESRIRLPQGVPSEACTLRLILTPFIVARLLPRQRLTVRIGDTEIYSATIAAKIDVSLDVPAGLVDAYSGVEIVLLHPDAMSPMALGESSDVRQLAILLHQLQWTGQGGAYQVPEPPAIPAPTLQNRPVFHVVPMGNLANRMIQYMVALTVKSRVPACEISNVQLPEWNLDLPALAPAGRILHIDESQHVDFDTIVGGLTSGQLNRVEYAGFGQRMENFLEPDAYRSVFRSGDHQVSSYGDDYLLINIRGAEIIDPIHPAYTLLPITFYRDIIDRTGLRPVFMGQLNRNIYTDRLRAEFPAATFLDSRDPMVDFAIIRAARNIVVSVSTFSWLAAWLSEARQIFLPVTGFYNVMQDHRTDLLPLDDPRYRFFLFPINYAVPQSALWATHAALTGLWREVAPDMLRDMLRQKPRYPRRLADYLAVFDANYYLSRWPDCCRAVEIGAFSSAVDHYIRVGFERGLEAFPFDRNWYVRTYPLAAFEVAQGDFMSLDHHFAAIGRRRGYAPTPPMAGS